MADQILNLKVFKVTNNDKGGAWVKAFMSMGKDKQTGKYNNGLWVSLYVSNQEIPQATQAITVNCYGMGWDVYTNPTTGEVSNTPKFMVKSWHHQTPPSQAQGVQSHPPTSSYQNQASW